MNKPTSLYIHIPFCQNICDYCDFTKLQYFRILAIKYLDSLKNELESYNITHQLKTIYIGGGTPTSLEDDLFEKLLDIVNKYSKGIKEYTIECNPESLSITKLQLMKKYGVNRISIGVESTNDEILKNINRHHNFTDVKEAINNAHKIGIDNINVDLIIGLPQVSEKLFINDLNNIISLDISHISCYSLTVHEHTKFYLNHIEEPNEELARHYYDLAENFLSQHGFIHYEISNWCKKGKESIHNLTYWKDETYYGIGLGASGYIDNIRYKNTINLDKYNKNLFIDEQEIVTLNDDIYYFIMLNLRTIFGLSLDELFKRTKVDLLKLKEKEIKLYINNKLLKLENNTLIPTYEGMMVLDSIIISLIP